MYKCIFTNPVVISYVQKDSESSLEFHHFRDFHQTARDRGTTTNRNKDRLTILLKHTVLPPHALCISAQPYCHEMIIQ